MGSQWGCSPGRFCSRRPANPANVVTGTMLIQVINNTSAPTPYLFPHTNTTPANITTPAVTVARNTSFQFLGGVVGALPCTSSTTMRHPVHPVINSVNNNPVWMVCPALPSQSQTVSRWSTVSAATHRGYCHANWPLHGSGRYPEPAPDHPRYCSGSSYHHQHQNFAYVGIN